MTSSEIAVVCTGREIAYGLNLFHLLQYNDEKEQFTSSKCDNLSVEMYSIAVFRHTGISQKAIRIYVGAAQSVDSSYKKVFDKFGMVIYQSENAYILKADAKQSDSYNEFISYANEKRKEYIELEKDYFIKVCTLDTNWIAGRFISASSGKLFKKIRPSVQQLYDCLSFVVYLNFLESA